MDFGAIVVLRHLGAERRALVAIDEMKSPLSLSEGFWFGFGRTHIGEMNQFRRAIEP